MPIETSMYAQTPTTKLDPAGAISMAQGMQSLQASKFDLVTKQMNTVRTALGSLAQDPDVTPEKVQAAGAMLVQQGLVQPQQLQGFMSGLQGKSGPELRGALSNHLATMMSAHENYLNANGGGEQAISQGDGTLLYRNSPRGGITQQGFVAQRPSAEFNASTQAGPVVRTPEGLMPTQETRGAAAAQGGYVAPGIGIAGPAVRNQLVTPSGPPARAPAVNKLTGQPAAPSASVPVAAPPAAAVAPSAAGGAALDRSAFGSPRVMGAAVGAAGAEERTAAASADQGVALEKASDAATDRKATLSSMEDHVKNISTGPLSGTIKTVGGTINQVAAMGGMDPIIKNQGEREKFDKLSAMLQQQRAALGVASDAGLANAGASSPNSSMTREGIEGMIAVGKGNEDAIRVKNEQWQKWKGKFGPNTYGAFQQQFQTDFEPRVFALPYMKKEAAQKLVNGMSEAERKQVQAAYVRAVNNGWIKRHGTE